MDELRNKIMSSIDDSSIPDLSYSIKTIYKDRLANKKAPWWKRKLTWGIAIPALTAATVCAIVLPLTVFKNKENTITPIVPVLNENFTQAEETYSVSALSLANVISTNVRVLAREQQSYQNQDPHRGNGWDGWDGWGGIYGGQDTLQTALEYCSQYMYVADTMLNNNLEAKPDDFTYEVNKNGSVDYTLVFNKDKEFECFFSFNENLKENKSEIATKGTLGIKNIANTFYIEGSRKNITRDGLSDITLDVKFDKDERYKNWWEQYKPVLTFREREDAENHTVYSFSYKQGYDNIYDVEMSCRETEYPDHTKRQWVEMDITCYTQRWTPYYPGGGGYYYQPQTFVFSVEKDEMDNLVLYLYNFGSKLFIDVRDKDGKYYYYLSQYNEDDYFAEGGKH